VAPDNHPIKPVVTALHDHGAVVGDRLRAREQRDGAQYAMIRMPPCASKNANSGPRRR
jgi:hypothetical protein